MTLPVNSVDSVVGFKNAVFVLAEGELFLIKLKGIKLEKLQISKDGVEAIKRHNRSLLAILGSDLMEINTDGQVTLVSNEIKRKEYKFKENEFVAKNEMNEFSYFVRLGEEVEIKRICDKTIHFGSDRYKVLVTY